jgi:hypothetical protein
MKTSNLTMGKSRAFKIGFIDSKFKINKNPYKLESKIKEYDTGFNHGLTMDKEITFYNKPQLFHKSVSSHSDKTLTISIMGNYIQDVVRENTDCKLVIHDYNIDESYAKTNKYCKQDERGIWFQEITLE